MSTKTKATRKTSKTSKTNEAPQAPVVAPVSQAPALVAHVIQTTYKTKDGAEKKYSCGAAPSSRTAKINSLLANATAPLATSEVISQLDALYGANVVKCVRNHLSTLLAKGAVTFTDKKWRIASAPAVEAPQAPAIVESKSKKRTRKSK